MFLQEIIIWQDIVQQQHIIHKNIPICSMTFD